MYPTSLLSQFQPIATATYPHTAAPHSWVSVGVTVLKDWVGWGFGHWVCLVWRADFGAIDFYTCVCVCDLSHMIQQIPGLFDCWT